METLAVVYSLKRFRSYLFGLKFKIVTDCNAMKMTLEKRDVCAKIERWALLIGEYDVEFEHRPGTRMQHVDALSRIYVVDIDDREEDEENEEIETDSFDRIRIKIVLAQDKDDEIQELKRKIEKGEKKGYEIRQGVVFRKYGRRLQLVVPEKTVASVITHMHDNMGHMGEEKTWTNITRNFFFTNMRDRIRMHIECCLPCLTFNPKSGRKEAKLKIFERIKEPFHTIHIDHMGPLEKTKKGKLHILAIVDGFTKFIRLFGTKTTNSTEVINALNKYIRAYGMPHRIVSDRGTAFTSNKFENWCKVRGIEHVLNATACPWANGQVERFNRTMVPVLAKLVDKTGKDWDFILDKCEYVLNNMTSSTTNESAYRLVFGKSQRKEENFKVEEYMEIINKEYDLTREESRELAGQNISKTQNYNKQYHDRKVIKETKFEENDIVLVKGRKKEGTKGKLYGKYKGPFIISKKLDKDRYVVTEIPGWQICRTPYTAILDPTRMKKYKVNQDNTDNDRFDEDKEIEVSDGLAEDDSEWSQEFLGFEDTIENG